MSRWNGVTEFTAGEAVLYILGDTPNPAHAQALRREIAKLPPDRVHVADKGMSWVRGKRIISRTSYYLRETVDRFAQENGIGTATQIKEIIPFNEPERRRDDWPDVIIDAIKRFEQKHGFTANEAQLWSQLITDPPPGYAVEWDDRHKQLVSQGNPSLNREAFNKRFANLYSK